MLERGGCPGGGFVAVLTNITCLKMRRRFTGCLRPVVT